MKNVEIVDMSVSGGGGCLGALQYRFKFLKNSQIKIAKDGSMSKKAFTFAEVLITLTIIGIVAVIILPAFTKNMSQNNFNRLKSQFDAKLVEATRQMNIQDGIAPYSDTESFVNKFKKYVKFPQICTSDKLNSCFGNYTITMDDEEFEAKDLKTSENLGKDYSIQNVGVTILDGMYFIMSYNPDCPPIDEYSYSKNSDTASCISYILDVNGKKKPNTVGKDVFLSGVILKKGVSTVSIPCVKTYGWAPCTTNFEVAEVDAVSTEYLGTSAGTGVNKLWASADGAKMSYALAEKTCSDMGLKLPNQAQLESMYSAYRKGILSGFMSEVYYSSNNGNRGENYIVGCNFGAGNCGQGEKGLYLNYVRCIK